MNAQPSDWPVRLGATPPWSRRWGGGGACYRRVEAWKRWRWRTRLTVKTANMEFMAWRSVQTGMGHWGTRPPSSLCPRDNRIGGGVLFLQLPSKASKPLCLHPAAGLLRPVPPRPPNSCIQYYKGPLPAEFTHCPPVPIRRIAHPPFPFPPSSICLRRTPGASPSSSNAAAYPASVLPAATSSRPTA